MSTGRALHTSHINGHSIIYISCNGTYVNVNTCLYQHRFETENMQINVHRIQCDGQLVHMPCKVNTPNTAHYLAHKG